jgi:hypothetical protein
MVFWHPNFAPKTPPEFRTHVPVTLAGQFSGRAIQSATLWVLRRLAEVVLVKAIPAFTPTSTLSCPGLSQLYGLEEK